MLGNSNESIFEFQFNTSALNGWYSAFASPTRRINASALIADFYGEVDPAFPDVIDIRADNGSYRYSDLTIWKQVGTLNVNTTVSASNSARHWFVYRYADILLMKAEALTWLDGGIPANADLALDLVKTIRTRANALSDTEESPSSDSPLDVSDYILRERAREFAFEGKRWFDLLRHAKRNNYAHLDLILDAISKVAPADKAQAILNKFKDVRSHYLPIALSELTADKLLVQNPFYQ
jgi:hypothetical protein